jgi:hypothetical protein
MQQPSAPWPTDLVTLVIALLSGWMANDVAMSLGPYLVIVAAALLSAAVATSGASYQSVGRVVRSMVARVGLALVGTVPLAIGLTKLLGLEVQWLLAPVAVLIAADPRLVWAELKSRFLGSRGTDDGKA